MTDNGKRVGIVKIKSFYIIDNSHNSPRPDSYFAGSVRSRSVRAKKLCASVLKISVIRGYVLIVNREHSTAAIDYFLGGLILVGNSVGEVYMNEGGQPIL